MITAAANYEAHLMMAECNANNGIYLKKLVDEQGVKLREFSDEVYEAFAKAAKIVFDETRQHSKLADKIYTSFEASRNNVSNWMKLSDISYSLKRNKALGI
jgi:TRAP-type mannitol/chloroaromatic compound transport system substrate-binding protein